MGINK